MQEPESGETDRVLAELVADFLHRLLKYRVLPGSPAFVPGMEVGDLIRASHPDDGQEFIIRGRGGTCHVDVYPGRKPDEEPVSNTSSSSGSGLTPGGSCRQ